LAINLTKCTSNDEIQLVLNDLTTFLTTKLPEKEEFVVKFSELEYTSKKTKHKAIVKYTLSKLIPSDNGCLSIDFDRLTIEHILSEARLKDDDSAAVSSIGNLVLLDEKTNSEELTDKDPIDKFKILENKKYPIHKAFLEPNQWGSEQINNRTKIMAEHIYSEIKSKII
jgi:hypothetical protein